MEKFGVLYETPVEIQAADKLPLLCKKGLKLEVVSDCLDASYWHEWSYHWREGLKEKGLKKGDVVEVLGCWRNFYGAYIRCTFNNETYDINPKCLLFKWELNKPEKG